MKVKLHDHIHDNDASDDADVKYSFETSDVSSGAHRVTSKEKRSTTNSNEPQKRDFSIKVEPGDISDGTNNGFNDRDDNPSDDNSDGIEQEDDEDDMKRFGEKNPLEEPSTTTMEKRSINISSKPIKRSDLTKIIKQVKKVLWFLHIDFFYFLSIFINIYLFVFALTLQSILRNHFDLLFSFDLVFNSQL